MHNTHNILMEN